jgi:15-cis-phytoene synthase
LPVRNQEGSRKNIGLPKGNCGDKRFNRRKTLYLWLRDMLNSMNEIKAAGITDSEIASSFLECRRLNALHGKTYFLATRLLPKSKRPFVHALYGFARFADEIVDDLHSPLSQAEKVKKFKKWKATTLQDLHSNKSDDPIIKSLLYTINRFEIDTHYFEAFLKSMEMDLTITEYQTFDDLMEYVYGSASVIGLQMVPILGATNLIEANKAAEKLGTAFQLANFIRDVSEDLDRGRIYLPIAELKQYGVSRQMLLTRKLTPEIKGALEFQIARVRKLQAEAKKGIKLLMPESRPCIEAASELYCGIVDEIEKINFQIFDKRAKTSNLRRAKVAIPALIRAVQVRHF